MEKEYASKKSKSKKWLWLIIILIIIVIGCILIFRKKEYKLDNSQLVAYTSLRLAIAKSAVDGTGEISTKYLDSLKSVAKNFNKNNNWFNDYSENFYGITKDTSDYQIDKICNSNYCAQFVVKTDKVNYYLVNYSFESKNDKGYSIKVTD